MAQDPHSQRAVKRCTGCGEVRPAGEFYKDHRTGALRGRCKECCSQHMRQWYEANREQAREVHQRWAAANRDRALAGSRRYHDESRAAVFAHYGEACACCGSAGRLTIDHVNGDGRQHREEISHRTFAGAPFYRWLMRNGFPSGFQTLCRPCNGSKGRGEHCRIDHALEGVLACQ